MTQTIRVGENSTCGSDWTRSTRWKRSYEGLDANAMSRARKNRPAQEWETMRLEESKDGGRRGTAMNTLPAQDATCTPTMRETPIEVLPLEKLRQKTTEHHKCKLKLQETRDRSPKLHLLANTSQPNTLVEIAIV